MPLDTLLLRILANCKQFVYPVYNSFLILYETGIRHAELNRENLIVLPDGNIKVISKKWSENRIITKDSLTIDCYNLISSFTKRDVVYSRSVLHNYFCGLSYPYRVMKGNHQLALHAFRYNFIQKQYAILQDYNLVQAIIGHRDINHTIMYINSVLTLQPVIFMPDFLPGELDRITVNNFYFNIL